MVGSNAKELGVRVPPNSNADIDLDGHENVVLNGRGMSVAENWRYLPPHLVPKRLRPILSSAAGSNELACFMHGNGPFQAGPINGRLVLVLKPHSPRVGNVVPSQLGSLREFQDDLAATRSDWSIDESWTTMNTKFFENPDFLKYVRLLNDLHTAIREGKDESTEGGNIRDQMDEPGSRLSPDEIAGVHGISADFYSVTDPLPTRILQRTADVNDDVAEALRARAAKDFNRALEILRRRAEYLEPAALAFQRGRTWMEAGEPTIATLFLERASELLPSNPNYPAVALHALLAADPQRARQRARDILQNSDSEPPRLVLIACQILFFEARESAREDAKAALSALVTAIRNAMARMVISGEAQILPSLFHQAFALLGLCFERLGDPTEALKCYNQGLTLDPGDPLLLMVRGMLLYAQDSLAAVRDFEHAIQRGSSLVWPYYFLSHHFLLSMSYRECLRTSTEGLQREASDGVRADLYEWIAISHASLGAPKQVVEASFQSALGLAPSNERIGANYELYERSHSASNWQKPTTDEVGRLGLEAFEMAVQIAA